MKTRGIAGKLFIMAASILGMMMATLFLVRRPRAPATIA